VSKRTGITGGKPDFKFLTANNLYAQDMAEDVDAETLQAQVDKSVARVQEIVSSWMKPYKGSYEASKVQEMVEKDIELYSARPPQ
jgi:tryptophan 2,3-dioxygenase